MTDDVAKFAKAMEAAARTTGAPSMRQYFWFRVIDNLPIVLLTSALVLLTLALWSIALFASLTADARALAFHGAFLCMGVFLGLFTGKRV